MTKHKHPQLSGSGRPDATSEIQRKPSVLERFSSKLSHTNRSESSKDLMPLSLENSRNEEILMVPRLTKANKGASLPHQPATAKEFQYYGRSSSIGNVLAQGSKTKKLQGTSGNTMATSGSMPLLETAGTSRDARNKPAASIKPVTRSPLRAEHDRKLYGELTCTNCGTQKGIVWRKDQNGCVLCNGCGLYLRSHGKPRPLEKDDDESLFADPAVNYIKENGRTKRRVTPLTTLSGSRTTTDDIVQAQSHNDASGHTSSTHRASNDQDSYAPSTAAEGRYDELASDENSSDIHYKPHSNGGRESKPAQRRSSVLHAYGGPSTSIDALYECPSPLSLSAFVQDESISSRNGGAKRYSAQSSRRTSTGRCRYSQYSCGQVSPLGVIDSILGDIDNVSLLTHEKRRSMQNHQQRQEETVIEDIIQQIPFADELAEEKREEDRAHGQEHYNLLRSASVGSINILGTDGKANKRASLLSTIDQDGVKHEHRVSGEIIRTASTPRHRKYHIRTETRLSEFPALGLAKPSDYTTSDAGGLEESGRRFDSQGRLVSHDGQLLYQAPERGSSKGKAGGTIFTEISGPSAKCSSTVRKTAHTPTPISRKRELSSLYHDKGRNASRGSASTIVHAPFIYSPSIYSGDEQAVQEQDHRSTSSRNNIVNSSINTNLSDSERAMLDDFPIPPKNIFQAQSRRLNEAREEFSRAIDLRAARAISESREREDAIKRRQKATHQTHKTELKKTQSDISGTSMTIDVPPRSSSRTPRKQARPRHGHSQNPYLGPNPYQKLLDRANQPRSKKDTPPPLTKSALAALDKVDPETPSESFLGDTKAQQRATTGRDSAQSKRHQKTKSSKRNPLEFDPYSDDEVEKFLFDCLIPVPAGPLTADPSKLSKRSVRTASAMTEEEAERILLESLFPEDASAGAASRHSASTIKGVDPRLPMNLDPVAGGTRSAPRTALSQRGRPGYPASSVAPMSPQSITRAKTGLAHNPIVRRVHINENVPGTPRDVRCEESRRCIKVKDEYHDFQRKLANETKMPLQVAKPEQGLTKKLSSGLKRAVSMGRLVKVEDLSPKSPPLQQRKTRKVKAHTPMVQSRHEKEPRAKAANSVAVKQEEETSKLTRSASMFHWKKRSAPMGLGGGCEAPPPKGNYRLWT